MARTTPSAQEDGAEASARPSEIAAGSHSGAPLQERNVSSLQHVWYSCYGSNLWLPRFRCYLEGGTPPGSTSHYCGSSDRTPISAIRSGTLKGWRLVFARCSESWADRDAGGTITHKGGVAFIEAASDASIFVRSYRITTMQFKDVFRQENRRKVLLPDDALGLAVGQSRDVGSGWYSQLIRLPDIDGEPGFTFSDPTVTEQTPRAPSRAYLRTLVRGMLEAFPAAQRTELIEALRASPGLATDQALGDGLPVLFDVESRALG